MRNIFLILIIAVLVLIAAIATNLIDIRQTRPAQAPDISASGNGITAAGGQTPEFKVETGSVTVGTKPANVQIPVPDVRVNPPANGAQPVTNAQ